MNKLMLVLMLFVLLLSACSAPTKWEDEEIQEVSTRILSDQVKVDWTLENNQASDHKAGTLIRLEVKKTDGVPIEQFDINHEKLLHLIIISKDLSYFNHIHPEYKGRGVFEITDEFPMGGEYRLIADFKPSKGDSMTKMTWLEVEGDLIESKPVTPDIELAHVTDGKLVELFINEYAVKKEVTLKFSITGAESGNPITDLEPYLGAIGHVVVLSEDGENYVHVHAEEGQGAGPDALFETSFPKSGIYKIWGQFQHQGQVFTAPFVINVP